MRIYSAYPLNTYQEPHKSRDHQILDRSRRLNALDFFRWLTSGFRCCLQQGFKITPTKVHLPRFIPRIIHDVIAAHRKPGLSVSAMDLIIIDFFLENFRPTNGWLMGVDFAPLICNPKNGSIFISRVDDFEGRARKSEILAVTEGF